MALKTEWKVGLFIVLTVVLILAGFGYMVYKKGIFQPENTYTLSSPGSLCPNPELEGYSHQGLS